MEDAIKQLDEMIRQAIDIIIEICSTKRIILEAYRMNDMSENNKNVEAPKNDDVLMIPFAAYETQQERYISQLRDVQDRFDFEKDKMRKHYRQIIVAISAVLIALIVGLFGSVLYILNNYDFTTTDLSQSLHTGDGGDATIEDGIHYNNDGEATN